MSKFTKNIEAELKKIKPFTNQKFFGEDYIGGGQSRLHFLNIKIPQVRSILDLPEFKTAIFQDIENLWFESKIFEAKAIALFWLEKQKLESLIALTPKLIKWSSEIDNWAHSDTYCGVLAQVFEENPQLLTTTYQKWNRHKNPWLRRISLVGLFYYSRLRKKRKPSFEMTTNFISAHLQAPEYYVQKAVGWTLRECYNTYPSETLAYVESNLHSIHPHAWYATTEKMPLNTKKNLVKKRMAQRAEKKSLTKVQKNRKSDSRPKKSVPKV